MNSILQYISAAFNNSIFNDKGVLFPNALIAIYFWFLLVNCLKKIIFFLRNFFAFRFMYMFIEANRYSEYGNDIPGLFYFLYVYLFIFGHKKIQSFLY